MFCDIELECDDYKGGLLILVPAGDTTVQQARVDQEITTPNGPANSITDVVYVELQIYKQCCLYSTTSTIIIRTQNKLRTSRSDVELRTIELKVQIELIDFM